ncbi:MAG: cysteine desulfurase-like protein [Anaerolineaceae bacterium]|nr:cysteine desulfurase-like protein [Anaerolineaceae bacterium]
MDVQALRKQFPALQQRGDDGRPIVFFDNPAGTQVPQAVIDAVGNYYRSMNANAGGLFSTSRRTYLMVSEVRAAMADFLNAPSDQEIVFGPNMTTLCFALARSLAQTLQPGDEIVLTRMDHDANVEPWRRVAARHGLVVRMVDFVQPECLLDMDSLEAALGDRTRIVATAHASNAAGSVNPVRQIASMAHAAGALYVVDAVQSAPHVPLDVQQIDCDFLLCSAYKFYGPHVGVLWGREDLLAQLPVDKVRPAKDLPPWRWETGTASFETLAGLGATIEYLDGIGRQQGDRHASRFARLSGRRQRLKSAMAALSIYERDLCRKLIAMLQRIPGLEVFGVTDPQSLDMSVPTVIFTLAGHNPADVAMRLGEQGIFVWSGDYYAQELMERLGHGAQGMVRVGLAQYNTMDEVQRLGVALEEIVRN